MSDKIIIGPFKLLSKLKFFAEQESVYRYCKVDYKSPYPIGNCIMCLGHSTEDEARDHYIQYLLDYLTKYDSELPNAEGCMVCGYGTRVAANVEVLGSYPLCNAHRNRDGLNLCVKVYHLQSRE